MAMRTLLAVCTGFALCAVAAPKTDWSVVAKLAAGTRVEVLPKDYRQQIVKGTVVRASDASMVVSGKTGEVSLDRASVRVVRTAAPHRRVRSGLIGVGVGTAAGLAIGTAVCLYCPNEGHSGFQGVGLAVGAALGAIAFLPMPYETIYKIPKK
jgi:hypothetical protein